MKVRILLLLVAILSFTTLTIADDTNFGATVKVPGGPDITIQKGTPTTPAPVVVERVTVVEKPSSCSCRAAKN